MKKLILLCCIIASSFTAIAQKKELSRKEIDRLADSIYKEGITLYKSEWASWHGTDIFLAKFKHKRSQSGGYFSYETPNGLINIFFDKAEDPNVLATISFQPGFNPANYLIDSAERKLTATEKSYYRIRKKAIEAINTDTVFKVYKNTTLNPVPIIEGNNKKVYILCAPKVDSVVVLGNDYLISFDKSGEMSGVRKIHKGIIPLQLNAAKAPNESPYSMHTHLPEYNELMTATDICTLMLYAHITPWGQHYTISKNYVSIWEMKKNKLFVMTMTAWKKINDYKDDKKGNNK